MTGTLCHPGMCRTTILHRCPAPTPFTTYLFKHALQVVDGHARVRRRHLQQPVAHPLQKLGSQAAHTTQCLAACHACHAPKPPTSSACLHGGLVQALLAALGGRGAGALRGPERQALGAAPLDEPVRVFRLCWGAC